MTDQTQRLEIATVNAEIGSNIVYRFTNDAADAALIPTDSGDIQNLKQVIISIQEDGAEKISFATTIYPSTAAGIAGTADGSIFLVRSTDPDEIYAVYSNTAGAAVDTGKRALSASAIQTAMDSALESANAAETSANLAAERVSPFLGTFAVAPEVRNDSTALQLGDRYFNSVDDLEYLYKASGWEPNNLDGAMLAAPDGSSRVGAILPGGESGTAQEALDAIQGGLQGLEGSLPFKMVERFPGGTIEDKFAAALADSRSVTLEGGDYPTLLNTSPKVFATERVAPKYLSPYPVVDVVHNSANVENLAYITSAGLRWDLLCGIRTTGVLHTGYNSGLFVTDSDVPSLYISYKEDTVAGLPAYLEKRTMSGVLVSGTALPADLGSMETFRVDGNTMRVGGSLADPAFWDLNATTGAVITKWTYSGVVFSSRQFASIDPLDKDRLVVLARQSGTGFGLFEFRFSKAVGNVLPLQQRIAINYGENEAPGIQGWSVVGEKGFMLTGDSATSSSKYLWEFRLWDGALVRKTLWKPNATYPVGVYGTSTAVNSVIEPEGLFATVLKRGGCETFCLYSGMMTSNASSEWRLMVWRGLAGIAESVPVAQGMPMRNLNTDNVIGRTVKYFLQFVKTAGVWQAAAENFRPSSTVSQVELVQVETPAGYTQPVLCFYLYLPIVGTLGAAVMLSKGARAFSYDAVFELDGGGSGGSTSTKQIVLFVDTKNGGYVSANTIPDGTRLLVELTAIAG